MRKIWLLAGAGAIGFTSAGYAQTTQAPPAPTMPDIVVLATPLGDGRAGNPAQGMTDKDVAAIHATDVTDYLRRISGGVFVNETQGNPLQPDINYRGFTASPLLGTPQGLSIYMDGVRLNQPFGDVVSWDLIPKSAIRSIDLVPGSNPLFGRNSLGGALSIRTKDGRSDPGLAMEGSVGAFGRGTAQGQYGGSKGALDWFVSGNYFGENGWRDYSTSHAYQLFGKAGWHDAATSVHLSGSFAHDNLNGNGLQEMRLLDADRASVYSQPDNTRNRALLVNLTATHDLSRSITLSGNAFYRTIDTNTYNGDVNDGSLGESLYQPNAAERAALTAAGYSGFPTAGETQANTPFPKWRCIAEALLDTEPNEKCNGLINRSSTRQREWGATGELAWTLPVTAGNNVLTAGFGYVGGWAHFQQSSQFGYLTSDRGVVGVTGPGAFADGTQNSENAFDARVNLTGRTSTISGYVLDALDLTPSLHADFSARFDRTTIHNRDAITPGGGTGSLDSDTHYNRLNPAVVLRWTPGAAFSFDAALAQTSRAPSAVELGCSDPTSPCRLPNALAGDPPLKQVVATTIEGGVNLHLGSVTARIGAFRTLPHDDILFVTDNASGFGYFRNFGATRRQGIDIDFSARPMPALIVQAHYTFLDATYRSAELVDGSGNSSSNAVAPGFDGSIAIGRGDRLPGIPRHLFKVSAVWEPVRLVSLDLDLMAQSGTLARGNENGGDVPDGVYYLGPGKTEGFAVVNAGVEVRPYKRLALYVQVRNLFDVRYATAAQIAATAFDASGNFSARPFPGPVIGGERPLVSSTFYAPGAPRSWELGAKVRF